MASYSQWTAIVLGASIIGSFLITQSLIVAMIVGTIWAIVGVAIGISKIPHRDSIGRWRSGETGRPITERAPGTAIAAAIFGPIVFIAVQGPNISQFMPWIASMAPEFQVPYFLGTSGLGFVLSR